MHYTYIVGRIIVPVPAAIRMSILLEHTAAAEKQPTGSQMETESPTKCTNHCFIYVYACPSFCKHFNTCIYNHCMPIVQTPRINVCQTI